ncbi:MAG: hypothetical protein RMJ48_02595 [Roseiflexaceae bacterium]|nr:hypothetical protein [Roseiflexaceae bacterium]
MSGFIINAPLYGYEPVIVLRYVDCGRRRRAEEFRFHIAFYLGVLAVRDHIISKDAGYDPLIQHLRAKNITAHRCEDVLDIPIIKKSLPSPPPLAPAHEPHSLPAAGAPSTTQRKQNRHPVDATTTSDARSSATNGESAKADHNTGQRALNVTALPELIETQLQKIIARLKPHPASRPRTIATLKKHIPSLLGRRVADETVEHIVGELHRRGVITIEQQQHVTYHFAP